MSTELIARRLVRLMTVEEAAERLGVKVATVRKWVQERTIGYQKVGKLVRISEDDLAAFLEKGRRPAMA